MISKYKKITYYILCWQYDEILTGIYRVCFSWLNRLPTNYNASDITQIKGDVARTFGDVHDNLALFYYGLDLHDCITRLA